MSGRMVILGLGYAGAAIAREAAAAGFSVAGTRRDPSAGPPLPGVEVIAFAEASGAVREATHIVSTAPPLPQGDPGLLAHRGALRENRGLRWIGYLSTTGVYGDRGGAWVNETSHPTPGQERSRLRLAAEQGWADFADRAAVDIFRTGGIYGPGRSPFAEIRAGTARRIVKPGHSFSRIHRDDIALAVVAAASAPPPPGVRVLHLVDDEPCPQAEFIAEAARLIGLPPPPELTFEQAAAEMSPMARSFWAENRKVSSARTKEALGILWRYPTYREGLAATLAAEGGAPAPAGA
ncbi:MAG: SDR family NAD(P)-dependent oxidoreductase [Acetobacteraceae bacterium]|nr:SDR family NAD(P)-dependent oxidoreductase [Acetobacteraceae bacterium]